MFEFIELINQYSGLLLVFLTAIGFWFVWRQIKLAKNKDIFFNFQQNLESELNFNAKKNFDFMSEYDELINGFIRNTAIVIYAYPASLGEKKNRRDEEEKRRNNFYLECWDIFKKYENIFPPKMIGLDRWWLNEYYNDLLELKNSKEYKKHINFIRNIHDKYKEHYETNNKSIAKLKKIIYAEYDISLTNSRKLEENVSKFLNKLAKQKGIL